MIIDPILLVPGLLCDRTVFQAQIAVLQQLVPIVVPDLSSASTPSAMVNAVLEHAPPRFHLIGHSMGGWVALEVMRVASHRVSKLGLLNTTAMPDSPEKRRARLQIINMARQGDYAAVVEQLLSIFLYQTHCVDQVRAMLQRNQLALIPQEEAMLCRSECFSVLKQMTCNTLVIHSNQDAVFSRADSEGLCEHIAQAKMVCLSGCGHMSPMEAPDEVTSHLLDFLSAD